MTGDDALHLRRRYLRKRRSRYQGTWLHGILWLAVIGTSCALGIASFAAFILGS